MVDLVTYLSRGLCCSVAAFTAKRDETLDELQKLLAKTEESQVCLLRHQALPCICGVVVVCSDVQYRLSSALMWSCMPSMRHAIQQCCGRGPALHHFSLELAASASAVAEHVCESIYSVGLNTSDRTVCGPNNRVMHGNLECQHGTRACLPTRTYHAGWLYRH